MVAVDVRSYGALGDGINDDSVAIADALAASKYVAFSPGVYRCKQVVVPSGSVLEGHDAVLLNDTPSVQTLALRGDNIMLRNLQFEGVSGGEWGVQLELDDGDLNNLHIQGCAFAHLLHAIRVRSRTALRATGGVYITGNAFRQLNGRAIDLMVQSMVVGEGQAYALDDFHIENNRFEDVAVSSSGKNGAPGTFSGAIYIGGLTSVTRFYLRDNVAYRVAPQFLAMSATANPRVDFVVSGNVVRQEGMQTIANMCYTFNNVDNLVFDANSCYEVDFEHLFLRDCQDFKISNSHFERANVGIAIHERTSNERCTGGIDNCTFVDIECPSDENSGNKGIFVTGDTAEIGISNCHFRRRNGTKTQIGVEINYFTMGQALGPRWGIQIDNCHYDGVVGIVIKSGGNAALPGHARVLLSTFTRCPTAVSFSYPLGNVVAYCIFDRCDIDVRTRYDSASLRCHHNLHVGTNPGNVAGYGAYVVETSSGKALWQIEGCTFRQVKGLHVLGPGPGLLEGTRILIWTNNDVDAESTGAPPAILIDP